MTKIAPGLGDTEFGEDDYIEIIQNLVDNNRRNISPSRRGRVENYVKKQATMQGSPFNQDAFDEAYEQIAGENGFAR